MDRRGTFTALENEIQSLLGGTADSTSFLRQICELLGDQIPYYDWVGFYLVDPENPNELVLGPYIGEPTDHIRIPFGRGICGQAAERKETFVIQDVSSQDNYLSCSINVRSEIVVPIMLDGRVIGEIDIDSHMVGPFTDEDSEFLKRLAELIAPALNQ